MKQGKLSALVDGELDEADIQALNQELKHPKALAKIEAYYRIGEELRAESARADLSPEFRAKMAAALEAEPPLDGQEPSILESNQTQAKSADELDPSDKSVEGTARPSQKQYVPGLVAIAALAMVLSQQTLPDIHLNTSAVLANFHHAIPILAS